MRTITYIAHSGFFVELDHCALLFDYEKGRIPQTDKPVYAFVSHAHHDHYNPAMMRLLSQQGATLLLSDDIKERYPNATYVHCDEIIQVGDLHIETLNSTDEGVAFYVEAEGQCIYHAGDLHWWHWEKESTPQENEEMKQAYLKELRKLKGKSIDIAFVPLDPRLETAYAYGLDAFFQEVGAEIVFPMHMWNEYSIIQKWKASPNAIAYAKHLIEIHHESEEFEV